MARYRDLGATALLTATRDTTLKNPGNWTIVASPQDLNCKVAQAEVHQITVNGPVNTTFKLLRNTQIFNDVVQGWSNVYDPVNPLYIRPGDTLYLFWRAPIARLPVPTATIWLRYDIDLPENFLPGVI